MYLCSGASCHHQLFASPEVLPVEKKTWFNLTCLLNCAQKRLLL